MSTPSHLSAMRQSNYAKPAPPMRKNASAGSHLDSSFPPPPPPISGEYFEPISGEYFEYITGEYFESL